MAQHLLLPVDRPTVEAVRGFEADSDESYDLIWDALARQFGYDFNPERRMRRKQMKHEQLQFSE